MNRKLSCDRVGVGTPSTRCQIYVFADGVSDLRFDRILDEMPTRRAVVDKKPLPLLDIFPRYSRCLPCLLAFLRRTRP